jgi:hypothetical protein
MSIQNAALMTQHFEPVSNELLIESLTLARQRIECGQNGYICNALQALIRLDEQFREPALVLQKHIMEDLFPESSLNDWFLLKCARSSQRMMQTARYVASPTLMRLCWIDRMIDNLTNYNNLKGPEV